MKNSVGMWVQSDAEREDLADFAVTGTYDLSTNMLGSQKYPDYCTLFSRAFFFSCLSIAWFLMCTTQSKNERSRTQPAHRCLRYKL